MCGFVAVVSTRPLSEKVKEDLSLSLRHRGPDGSNIVELCSNYLHVTLIHARLAIIDADNTLAAQPMRRKGWWLVFNGEIYNYMAIRKELEELGHVFLTRSDTEVLAAFIEQYEGQHLWKLKGMWSFFAVKDDLSMWIYSRDVFGQKPLFHANLPGGFCVASTMTQSKVVLTSFGVSQSLNADNIINYLYYGHRGYFFDQGTIWSGITRVRQNSVAIGNFRSSLVAEKDILYPEDFFSIRQSSYDLSHDALSSQLAGSLVKDTRIRLGVLLSGGLDSQFVASLVERNLQQDYFAYTLQTLDDRYDESRLVNESLPFYKRMHHSYVRMSSDKSLELLGLLIKQNSDIVPSITTVANLAVAHQAKLDDVRILLTGTGGDEIFGGYLVHHMYYLAYLRDHQDPTYLDELNKWRSDVMPWLRNPFLQDPDNFQSTSCGIWMDSEYERQCVRSVSDFDRRKEQLIDAVPKLRTNVFIQSLWADLMYSSLPAQTCSSDYVSMNFGIENRAPLLNSSLCQYTMHQDPTQFYTPYGSKSLMRQLFSALIPPPILSNSEKKGFNIPFENVCSRESLEHFIYSSPNFYLIDQLYDIRSLLERMTSSVPLSNSLSKLLFRLLVISFF